MSVPNDLEAARQEAARQLEEARERAAADLRAAQEAAARLAELTRAEGSR